MPKCTELETTAQQAPAVTHPQAEVPGPSSASEHDASPEAFEHGIYEIAHGVADLAIAFIESLPHGRCFHDAGFAFGPLDAAARAGRSRRG